MPMTISQKYFLAHQARGKLARAAARPDHDLRVLCGHANLLDDLMLNLASAEQEQERWYHESLAGARAEKQVVEHEDTIMEEAEEYEVEDSSSDSDSDYEEDEDQFEESLALTRTTSRPAQSPPELILEEDSEDSDEEHLPPSPPTIAVEKLPTEQAKGINKDALYPTSAESTSIVVRDFYTPTQHQPTIIAAY